MEDIIDVLFALDVFYTFRTAYIDNQGEMVRDGGKIATHYLSSWFPIDVLASMPLEYVVIVFGLDGGTNLTYFAFLKVGPHHQLTLVSHLLLQPGSPASGCCFNAHN
jgi:hypothetical protein